MGEKSNKNKAKARGSSGKAMRALGNWRKELKEICNKEAAIKIDIQKGGYAGILPKTLVLAAWKSTVRNIVIQAVGEEGAGNTARIKARALGLLREDVEKVMDDLIAEQVIYVNSRPRAVTVTRQEQGDAESHKEDGGDSLSLGPE
jgi:hypothetical protein